MERDVDPMSRFLSFGWTFPQLLVNKDVASFTVKTYTSAMSSGHEGFGERSVFNHPLVKCFIKGVMRQRPVVCYLGPQWDLSLVLCTLRELPLKPLDQITTELLFIKTALLLALTSAKRVRDLCTLSVSLSCLTIWEDSSSAVLRPNPVLE